MRKIEDGRVRPQIAGQAKWQSLLILFALRLGGWIALAVDGHELFASYSSHCEKCCTRNIKTKKGERTQYYHRIVAAHLVGGPLPILLGAEEIRPGEGEIEAARRLLERVQRRYPKAPQRC